MQKPTKTMSRPALMQWLDENGDKQTRIDFVETMQLQNKSLSKDQVYGLARAAYDRAQVAA